MIYRLTSKVALTNFNGVYISLVLLGIATLIGLAGGTDDFPPGNLLFALGLVMAMNCGLLLGTSLTEIKVKPFSWCLPGQERSMGPALVLTAAPGGALYAALLLLRPMPSLALWPQSLSLFCWSLGVCLTVATLAVVTRDTVINTLIGMLLFLLMAAGLSGEQYANAWIAVTRVLASMPIAAFVFMAASLAATLFALSRRGLSHRLCGAPFLPLKAQDPPFRIHEYHRKMRQGALKPSFMTRTDGLPGSRILTMFSRRVAGTSFDYLVLDSRITHNAWEFLLKLLYLVTILSFMTFFLYRAEPDLFIVLFYVVCITFAFFTPTFLARLSPMLPVSRRQHFQSFLLKCVTIYIVTLLALIPLNVLFTAVTNLFGTDVDSAMTALPFKALLVIAASVPILCWGFTTFRSVFGFIAFMLSFVVLIATPVIAAQQSVLAQGYAMILLASLIAWLPFLFIAFKRCLLDDLLLP